MEAGKSGKPKMANNFDEYSCFAIEEELAAVESALYKTTPKQKLYFAGPWFDVRADMLYKSCQKIINKCKSDSKYDVFFPKDAVSITPKDAFDRNVKEIQECDALVALVSRKDVGTAWEIGMAYALGKPIYLLGFDKTTFLSHTNVMLAFTGKCFTIHNLMKFLIYGLSNDDLIHIKNEWEGIE